MSERRGRRRRSTRTVDSKAESAEVASVATGGNAPPLTRSTGLFGSAGIVVAAIGFYLLSQGSIALAPALLLVAFLVLFPLALTR